MNPSDPTFEPVYDSAHIQRYLVEKFANKGPKLLTGDIDLDLKAYQLQVLSEGVMDAMVLRSFENARAEEKQSKEWAERQTRKINGGLKAFDELAKHRKGEYLIGDGKVYTIADIAVACAVGHLDFVNAAPGWREQYPSIMEWFDKMEQREYHAQTRPVMFDIKWDTIV